MTVAALRTQSLVDKRFRYHLAAAKKNGVAREEIAEIVAHAAFRIAKDVWNDEKENG